MLDNDDGQATGSEDLSLDAAAAGFADLLSEEEDPKGRETQQTPPAKPDSTASESEDEKPASEAGDSEDDTDAPGDKSGDDTEDSPTATLDPNLRVRVKVDGVEEEITLEEALKGYSRTAVFTRKTQELAKQREAQASEFQAVRGERAKYADLIVQFEQALVDATGPEPDWAKIQTEQPDQFPSMWAQWNQRKQELEAVATERARATEAVAKDRKEAHQRYLTEEQTKLIDALPEWKDAEKAKAGKAELVAYAERVGFSKEELAQVADHRAVLLLRKAMLFDKAQANKPDLTKRIETVKTVTPGPTATAKKPVSEGTKARQRLAKTGRIDDAAAAFESMID